MKPDFLELLRALDRAEVEHVIVGGVAAILEGAPIATLDLDIVCRLELMLGELEARYRDPAGRDIRPTRERLANHEINLLETRLGPLDVMHRIGPGWSWDETVERSRILSVGELEVRVLGLRSVIESKVATNREKDRAMLPVLRRTLEQK